MKPGTYTDAMGRRVHVSITAGGAYLLRYSDGTTTTVGGAR